jgi:hypothetical protein
MGLAMTKARRELGKQVAARLNEIGMPCFDSEVFKVLMFQFLNQKAVLICWKTPCVDCGKPEFKIAFKPRTKKALRTLFK